MAHHTTHRRTLASPGPEPPISSSMDPTLKRHPKPPSTKLPDPPFLPSTLFDMSKLYPNQKPHKSSSKHPPCKDIHLQAKAMTFSADFDASRFSLNKFNHHNHKPTTATTVSEEASKEEKKKKTKEVNSNSMVKKDNKEVMKELIERHDIKRMSVSLGGRRRSFCGSPVELADFLASNGAKIVSVDMPPFMQIHAVDCARKTSDSLEKFTSKTLALTLKKEFDGVYGPAWHCIVGTSFGSFVTHSVGGFLYFSLDQKLYILLFKTTVQRAD